MLLSELPESQATGRHREIYAELKYLGGVPMVALIFRHLATLPGALEWAWDAIGPAWKQGYLQETAWRLAREAPLEPIASIPPAALRALGVDAAGIHEVRVVLEAYNRANPENMLSVLCICRLLEGHQAKAPMETGTWLPPIPPGPLVAMVDVARMPREVGDLFDVVAAPGEAGGPRVVQSLYRHFGHRPGFLALVVTLLKQRFDDGAIDFSVAAVRAEMEAAADKLVATLQAPPAPAESRAGILAVCERFGTGVIPQMIVVGRLLEKALPA